jgi:Tfp pilus assembly protein FimT
VRTLAIATILAALAVPALAQDMAGSNKHHGAPKKHAEQPKVQANDQDYKSALDRLPQQKYDPWGTARSTGGSDKPR